MSTYKVIYSFEGREKDMLSVKSGDIITVLKSSGNGWCTVRSSTGKQGLVPSSYIEAVSNIEEEAAVKGTQYIALYDFSADQPHQLSIKSGDILELVHATTNDWWSMKHLQTKREGLVPRSYIAPNEKPTEENSEKALTEVLLSIDNAIEKIHNDAMLANNVYTDQQRSTLQTLIAHRNEVVSQKNMFSPRRKPPPPPTNSTPEPAPESELTESVEPLDLANVPLRDKSHLSSNASRPKSEVIPKRPAPPPPTRVDSLKVQQKVKPAPVERGSRESSSSSSDGIPEAVSPNTKKRIASYLSRVNGGPLETVNEVKSPDSEKKIELPTEFATDIALELIDVVRNRTELSHPKSALAVEGVLKYLEDSIPIIAPVMEGLLSALHKSQLQTSSAVTSTNQDLKRLQEIFFEMREARDDSQQRGWAVRDDSEAIGKYLEELLQILYDADPDVSKVAIQEDKYENILTLITYYQLEHRLSLRILLLRVFGACCTLDQTVISVVLQSVLPNELGHDIQVNLNETEKTLLSSIVCVMMFSTAEDVPLPVYDQWNLDFVKFLLEVIEDPPESDVDDELPDAFLNMLLSFNQHFEYPSTNTLMQALKECDNPRTFSEKVMLLVNRGDDPVCINTPCCPDSLTKLLLDLFSDNTTSSIFYTTDLMVLIDIITRQLHDLSPGDKVRSHYIELLNRLVSSTDYTEHCHRKDDISNCLQRILKEEDKESQPDQEAIRKLFDTHPNIFN